MLHPAWGKILEMAIEHRGTRYEPLPPRDHLCSTTVLLAGPETSSHAGTDGER